MGADHIRPQSYRSVPKTTIYPGCQNNADCLHTKEMEVIIAGNRGSIVVRDRESLLHGEGNQSIIPSKIGGEWGKPQMHDSKCQCYQTIIGNSGTFEKMLSGAHG